MLVDDINRPNGTVFEFRTEGVRLWCDLVRYVPRKYWFGKRRLTLEYLWMNITEISPTNLEQKKFILAKQVIDAYNVRKVINS